MLLRKYGLVWYLGICRRGHPPSRPRGAGALRVTCHKIANGAGERDLEMAPRPRHNERPQNLDLETLKVGTALN
jgi:hypothetical protein